MPQLVRFFLLFLLVIRVFSPVVFAKTIDEEIGDITRQISELENAIKPLKQETTSLKSKIASAKTQINAAEAKINDLGTRLIDRQIDLEVQKVLLSQRVRRYYINSKKYNPYLIFFASDQSTSLLRQFTWFQSVISQDRNLIIAHVNGITSLNIQKSKLEGEKVKLAALRKNLESRFGFLEKEITKAETYKAELSRRQQSLIAEKNAMFNTSVGDVSSSDDPASRADYNPGFSPAFAGFSFGAPHRKGMSQFGAFGRSKAGQNFETILKAYYGDIKIEKLDSPGSIKTSVGTLPFEENYLVGIAEMPSSWGDQGGFEALKAQAIAARTYAISYTNNLSGSICVTEACQVYKRSRYEAGGTWKRAVEETRGLVVKSNSTGNIFSTMYASTSGGANYGYSSLGHSTPQNWDTPCGNQGCWPNDSYEKQAGSSWYYKGWYKTRSNVSAGRSHPWLTGDEFADIINAVLYFSKTNDSSHLSQIQNCLGSCDSDAWSRDELRRQVEGKGGPVSSVNSVSVDYSTGGYTKTVRLSTDKGDFSFDGGDFKDIFTLRAPGALTLKSSLFNIERK
ncbi:MAG: SpoIID/LytB domain-containing protein [Candidatus Shapirobacteria bacterium]